MSSDIKKLEVPYGRGEARESRLTQFANIILQLNEEQAAQKMSSRGWCYFIEGFNLITKGQFDKVQDAINECRKKGYLPIDFTLEHRMRVWQGVEDPSKEPPEEYLKSWVEGASNAEEYYRPDWWSGEKYYIQAMVEKIDLVEMFLPICQQYHIPIVNAGGWYDINERGEAAKRFKATAEKGCLPVLIYFGDLDPWGEAISDFIYKNFVEISGGSKWLPPQNMKWVDRFGLNADFIESQGLTWIDNLESGSGRDLSRMDNRIVHDYVAKYGIRKCEANAVMRVSAREPTLTLLRTTIEKYLGKDALHRFSEKRQEVRRVLGEFKKRTGLDTALERALNMFEK
jgi:hypothetical protein